MNHLRETESLKKLITEMAQLGKPKNIQPDTDI